VHGDFLLTFNLHGYMNIAERIGASAGGASGRYRSSAHGYFAFPELDEGVYCGTVPEMAEALA